MLTITHRGFYAELFVGMAFLDQLKDQTLIVSSGIHRNE